MRYDSKIRIPPSLSVSLSFSVNDRAEKQSGELGEIIKMKNGRICTAVMHLSVPLSKRTNEGRDRRAGLKNGRRRTKERNDLHAEGSRIRRERKLQSVPNPKVASTPHRTCRTEAHQVSRTTDKRRGETGP